MRKLGYSLLFLVSLTTSLLLTAPAERILPLVSPDNVQLTGIQGNLLSGQIRSIQAEGVTAGPLHWRFDLVSTLAGLPSFQVESVTPYRGRWTGLLEVAWRGDSIAVKDSTLKVRLAPLLAEAALPIPLKLDGNGILVFDQFLPGTPCGSVKGKLSLSQLSSEEFSFLNTLKPIEGQVSCTNNNYLIDLSSKDRALSGTLKLLVSANGSYNVNGQLDSDNADAIALLSMVTGASRPPFKINYRGRL